MTTGKVAHDDPPSGWRNLIYAVFYRIYRMRTGTFRRFEGRCRLVAALIFLCAGASTAAGEVASPATQRVYSILRSQASDSDGTYFADSYLFTLTPPQQLEVARTLSMDASTSYVRYGALLLVRLKHADEAIAPTAHLLLSGEDISGLFWSWLNFDDPCLTDSMTLLLGRYLLHEHPQLRGAEKKRAEEYLAGIGPPEHKFRMSAAQADLEAIAQRLEHRGCHAPSADAP
jgi:hypothetical protein